MKVHTTFRCDIVVKEEAKTVAKRENRPLSNLIETALRDYLLKKKEADSDGK